MITEEIFFRIIEDRWGTIIALASSAVIFTVMHLANENAGFMTFLCIICRRGGFRYPGHLHEKPIGSDRISFRMELVAGDFRIRSLGGDEFSKLYIFNLKLSGPDLITGGISGIENSVPAVLIMVILFIVPYKKSRDSDKQSC